MMVAGEGMEWEMERVEAKLRGVGEMLGTTDPTLGTGDEIRGDIEGMADNWERRVTSVPVDPSSDEPSLSPAEKKLKYLPKNTNF